MFIAVTNVETPSSKLVPVPKQNTVKVYNGLWSTAPIEMRNTIVLRLPTERE
jgi:hypothetical protein